MLAPAAPATWRSRQKCRRTSAALRHRGLRPSRQYPDRSGPVKNLHPMSQSLKESSTRGNEQMISVAHFSIPVSDIAKSTGFSTEVLGCRHWAFGQARCRLLRPARHGEAMDQGGRLLYWILTDSPLEGDGLELLVPQQESPGFPKRSGSCPDGRGPIRLRPPSRSSASARPRRHLAVPARQVCEAGSRRASLMQVRCGRPGRGLGRRPDPR